MYEKNSSALVLGILALVMVTGIMWGLVLADLRFSEQLFSTGSFTLLVSFAGIGAGSSIVFTILFFINAKRKQ
ncbi:MAG: hypothetical protein HYS60_01500 [Candidatus Wildermuthbacteria bacterium]|nr:hypothetical protein [Candidatus Wildermuthbacteria bacterium]